MVCGTPCRYKTARKGAKRKRKDPDEQDIQWVQDYLAARAPLLSHSLVCPKSGFSLCVPCAAEEAAAGGGAGDQEGAAAAGAPAATSLQIKKTVWGMLKALDLDQYTTFSTLTVGRIKGLYQFFGGDYGDNDQGSESSFPARKDIMAGHVLVHIANVMAPHGRLDDSEMGFKFADIAGAGDV